MLIEAVLREKIEPIVLQTAGSAEVNSVCISEGSFQNILNYNKQKLQGGTPWEKTGLGIRRSGSQLNGKSLTSEWHFLKCRF